MDANAYHLCQSHLEPTEVIKVATSVAEDTRNAILSSGKVLAVIANVESGSEEAALLHISCTNSSIIAVVPLYSDFKVAFEQVETEQVAPLESTGKPVQARFQAKFTAVSGRSSISVTTSNLADLDDLLRETRRLTSIAEQNDFSAQSSSHVWLAPYLSHLPKRQTDTPASPSAVSTLFAYGSKAIEGLPGLASTFGSFGFLSGSLAAGPANAKSRGLPSAMSVFGSAPPALPPRPAKSVAVSSLDKDAQHRLAERRDEYTSKQNFKIHVCAFNTNGQFCDPAADLSAWIQPEHEPDLLVAGLQEMDLRPEVLMVRHDPLVGEAWSDAILACLHKHDGKEEDKKQPVYALVETKQLAGMWIAVIAKKKLIDEGHLGQSTSTSVMTGAFGFAGNKGACCLRFRLHDTYLCFICAHLAAFQDSTERRNADYRDICNRAIFSSPDVNSPTGSSYSTIFDPHLTIFFGDLNYRLDHPIDHIRSKLSEEKYDDLLAHDQLKRSQKEGLAFERFKEGHISFPPTYKYDKGTDTYDTSEKERKPAWTDRVLWKQNHYHSYAHGSEKVPAINVDCKEYTSVKEMRMSDHKPVLARLEIEVPVVDEDKREKVIKELQAESKA